jgi:hypothetical protein
MRFRVSFDLDLSQEQARAAWGELIALGAIPGVGRESLSERRAALMGLLQKNIASTGTDTRPATLTNIRVEIDRSV